MSERGGALETSRNIGSARDLRVERFEELQGDSIADPGIRWRDRDVDRYAIAVDSGRHPVDGAQSRLGTSPDVIRSASPAHR